MCVIEGLTTPFLSHTMMKELGLVHKNYPHHMEPPAVNVNNLMAAPSQSKAKQKSMIQYGGVGCNLK
jgi:hypothetical protein